MQCYVKMSFAGHREVVSELTAAVTATYASWGKTRTRTCLRTTDFKSLSVVSQRNTTSPHVNDFAAFVAFVKFRVTLNDAEWHPVLCPQCALRNSRVVVANHRLDRVGVGA